MSWSNGNAPGPTGERVSRRLWKSMWSYSNFTDQFWKNAHSKPTPNIQPHRVSVALERSEPPVTDDQYLSCAKAAPPFTKNSAWSKAMPARPASVPTVSVLEWSVIAGNDGTVWDPCRLVALICASTPPTNHAIW